MDLAFKHGILEYAMLQRPRKLAENKKNSNFHTKKKRKSWKESGKIDQKNPKMFFKHAKSKTKVKASIGPLKRDENSNKLITDPQEICEILKEQYISSYRILKEETELPAAENHAEEDC